MFVTHFKRCKTDDRDVMCWKTHDVTVTFHSCTTFLMTTDFHDFFHAVNMAIKQQQYCNTVRPQLNSYSFTQRMTSQTWRLKRLFLNHSFSFKIRVTGIFTKGTYFFVANVL